MAITHRRRVALLLTMQQRYWYQQASVDFSDLPDGALASGTYQGDIGKIIVTATNNTPVISGGALSYSSAAGNQRFINITNQEGGGFPSLIGLCLTFDISSTTGTNTSFGFGSTNAAYNTSNDNITYRLNAGGMVLTKPTAAAKTLGTFTTANTQRFYVLIVADANNDPGINGRTFLLRRDATDGVVRIESILGAFNTTTPRYPFISANNSTGVLDNIRLTRLLSPFTITPVLRTLSANGTADGTVLSTLVADGFYTFELEIDVGETSNFLLRRSDDNNALYFRIAETANTVKIIRKEAGVETELASVNTAVASGGHTLQVQLYGSRVQAWFNLVRVGQVTETFNQTQDGGKIDTNSGSDVTGYPSSITGTFLTQLQAAGLA